MTYSLVLFDDGLMSLRVVVYDGGLATIIEEELSLVQIFLVARYQIELSQRHLCNLMSWHNTGLTRVRTNFLAHYIGITDGDVEELSAARSLIVGDGALYRYLYRKAFLSAVSRSLYT